MSEGIKPGIDYVGIATPFYCNDGNGRFLLHKRGENARDERGNWDFGSGELNPRQTVEASALREVFEEWGVEGEIQEQIPPHIIERKVGEKDTFWLVIPFFIKVDVEKAKIMEPDKFSAMGIFTLDNLPSPLHTGVLRTMSVYSPYFEKYKINLE